MADLFAGCAQRVCGPCSFAPRDSRSPSEFGRWPPYIREKTVVGQLMINSLPFHSFSCRRSR